MHHLSFLSTCLLPPVGTLPIPSLCLPCYLFVEHCSLKGQCHKIFCFRFFSKNTFPQAPDNNIRIISKFFEISRRYSQVKVHHRCQRHRWQIIGTISGCRHLQVNLKAKIYIYVSSTTQRWPNKIIKNFLIEDFFNLPPVSLTPLANLELRISPWIFEKIRYGLNGILRGWGETDFMKRTRSKKSRDTVPLTQAASRAVSSCLSDRLLQNRLLVSGKMTLQPSCLLWALSKCPFYQPVAPAFLDKPVILFCEPVCLPACLTTCLPPLGHLSCSPRACLVIRIIRMFVSLPAPQCSCDLPVFFGPNACLPACPHARLSACLPACPPACLSPCLPACLPACLPVCLPACLPACLPTCQGKPVCMRGLL